MEEQLFDVVAVGLHSGKVEAIFGEGTTAANAEAIVSMAVMRRGVGTQFYQPVPAGSLKVGDAV